MYEDLRNIRISEDGNFFTGQTQGGGNDATLVFEDGTMVADIPLPRGYKEWPRVAEQAKTVARLVPYLTALCQRGVNHPADFGLKWIPSAPGTHRADRIPPHRAEQRFVHYGPPLSSMVRPEEESNGMWIAPDADPSVFGTPYVAAELGIPEPGVYRTVWVMGLCGLTVRLSEATWDDADACTEIFQAVLQGSDAIEANLAHAALTTNADLMRDAYLASQLRHETRLAFSNFAPRDRVKPKLVKQAAKGAGVPVPGLDVKVIKVEEDGKGHINVAVAFEFPDHFNDIDAWVAAVQPQLDLRNLGAIVQYDDNGRTVAVVTPRPDLVNRYRFVYGLPETANLKQATVNDGNVSWHDVATD